MAVNYQVRVYNTDGELQAVISNYRNLTIEHRTNLPSTCTIIMYARDPAIQFFTLDALIEVRRTYPEAGIDWYTEFIGFHRTPQLQVTPEDALIFTSYSRSLLDLVRRRSIRYYADTDGSAKGPGPADDVIKDYVRENCGSLATVANNRVNDGIFPGFTIAANLSQAPTFEGADAWRNLLEAITDIGEPNNVDFDVVWLGGGNFEFRTYYPHLGTDRRVGTPNSFTFAIARGNVSNPSTTVSRTDEVTSALVLGPGEGPLRDTTLINSPAALHSPFNFIEAEYNGSGEDREAALNAAGNKLLYEKRAIKQVTLEPIQHALSAYHKHYFLGDLVTAVFVTLPSNIMPNTADVKIRAITLTIATSVEQITIELEEFVEAFNYVPSASSRRQRGPGRP